MKIALAAEVHLAGQSLLAGQTLNIKNTLIYRAPTRRPKLFKREGQNLEST
jgi:hypothetical protein